MNSVDAEEVLELALITYGLEAQKLVMYEEMSELTKELIKHSRDGRNNREEIKDEVADVMIMLLQMVRAFKISDDEIADQIDKKVLRLKNRLDMRLGKS